MAELPAHVKPVTGKALEAAKKQRAAHLLALKKSSRGFSRMPRGGSMGR